MLNLKLKNFYVKGCFSMSIALCFSSLYNDFYDFEFEDSFFIWNLNIVVKENATT